MGIEQVGLGLKVIVAGLVASSLVAAASLGLAAPAAMAQGLEAGSGSGNHLTLSDGTGLAVTITIAHVYRGRPGGPSTGIRQPGPGLSDFTVVGIDRAAGEIFLVACEGGEVRRYSIVKYTSAAEVLQIERGDILEGVISRPPLAAKAPS